jgi:hypothetical protein
VNQYATQSIYKNYLSYYKIIKKKMKEELQKNLIEEMTKNNKKQLRRR